MGRFSIPEQIIGIPLWVPAAHNFFEIEDDAMPNGDSCLVMRGDLSTDYKAFIKAPTLSPINIFGSSDTVVPREWSMSCWLKLANLASGATGAMFGCTTRDASATMPAGSGGNQNVALMVKQDATVNGFDVYRDTLNNAAGASNQAVSISSQAGNLGWHMFQDYWFLFVVTFTSSFSSPNFAVTGRVYMDTYDSVMASHASAGTAASGTYGTPLYLHIGSYQTSLVGRADIWRMAKWAFHDHALTQAERQSMWDAMYTTPQVFVDDFNRASIGTNWRAATSNNIAITSNVVSDTSNTTESRSAWVKDIGTPDMYAQLVYAAFSGSSGWGKACVRIQPFASAADCYRGGWDIASGQWQIDRHGSGGSTSLATTSSGPAQVGDVVRLEAETVSGNVDLRLYVNGVLKLSVTDSSGSKVLLGSNSGISIRGGSTGAMQVDNFECGAL